MRSFMKTFLNYFSVLVFLFSFSQVALADCPVTLQCGERLELNWSYSGEINTGTCDVSAPGQPISGSCASGGWTSNNVPVASGSYVFTATAQNGQPLSATCQVTAPPANCGTTGGTYDISASPNPVQICSPATLGASTISWTVPSNEQGQVFYVYLSVNGGPASPSMPSTGGTGNGSEVAPWIQVGNTYTFSLRKASTPNVVQDSVTVTGTNSGCSTGGVGICGDGVVYGTPPNTGLPEQCDDGNVVNGDGCSSTCQVETPAPTQYLCQSSMCSACGGTTGVTCPASGTYSTSAACSNACGSTGGTQYYKCDGTSCVSSGQYPDLDACILATGGAQNCKTTPDCDNQCSGQTQNLYYRCSAPNSGNSCTTSVNVPCAQGEAGCYSLNSNPNAATQCAQYCGSQQYTCGGSNGCITCGGSGQPACTPGLTFTNLSQCNLSSQCQNTPSCSFVASPSSGTVGSTVNLTFSSSPGAISCQYNRNPNQSASSGTSGMSYSGPSLPLVSGSNVFNALCNYSGFGQISCSSGTVTGTTATPVTRYQCSGGTGPCTQTTCDPSNDACINSTYATPSACESATSCNASAPTLGAACQGVTLPSRILVGQTFTVTPSFLNLGTTAWTTSFSAVSSSLDWSAWNGIVRLVPGTVGQFGTFSPAYILTAPSSVGNYSLQFQMRNTSGVAFDSVCQVYMSGTPGVDVSAPECSDNKDNADPEDTLKDALDPACIRGGTYDPNWDNETDPAPGATLKISANPQLVRFGGGSEISYEVGNCKVDDGEGNLVDGVWELKRDGSSMSPVISGTGTTNGPQAYPVYNIQNKTTFTLSCGGTTRSATISVIKINEI